MHANPRLLGAELCFPPRAMLNLRGGGCGSCTTIQWTKPPPKHRSNCICSFQPRNVIRMPPFALQCNAHGLERPALGTEYSCGGRPSHPRSQRLQAPCRSAVRCQAGNGVSTGSEAAVHRRSAMLGGLAVGAALTMPMPGPASAGPVLSKDWAIVDLPIDPGVVLLDVDFTSSDPNHGE